MGFYYEDETAWWRGGWPVSAEASDRLGAWMEMRQWPVFRPVLIFVKEALLLLKFAKYSVTSHLLFRAKRGICACFRAAVICEPQ